MSVINLSQKWGKGAAFLQRINKESGEDVRNCYQCGKCSAGCPMAFAMDYRPNRILRMIQLGMSEEVLNSRTIWVCATCSTCISRCPRNVDLCKIMDTCRVIAYQEGKTAKVKNEVLFHEIFMGSIKSHGRLYELGLMMARNLRSGNVFQDAELGLPTMLKGKLSLLPPRFEGSDEVKRIIEAVHRVEGESEHEI